MSKFSLLIIENKVSAAARVVRATCEHLPDFSVSVINDLAEAVEEPEPADLILLNTCLLQPGISALSSLAAVYPHIPVILLHEPPEGDESRDRLLLAALEAGGEDYVSLTRAGLTVLGKRIASLQETWQKQRRLQPQTKLPISQILSKALISDQTGLAVQVIGPDDTVQAWNRTAEVLFGVEREKAIGLPLDQLPLSDSNLSRLKDIVEQARTKEEPFSVSTYPLEALQAGPRWGQVHVYPVIRNQAAPAEEQVTDICIISADISGLRRQELECRHHNQVLQNELSIFYDASTTIATTWDTEEILTTLIGQMVQGMAVSYGLIAGWDKNQQQGTVQATFAAADGSSPKTVDLEHIITLKNRPALSMVVNRQQPVFLQLNSSSLDPSEQRHMETYGCFSRLLVPLVAKGETIGWAELWETQQNRLFSTDEIRLVRMLANQVAVTLENARYLKQTQQTLDETTALYQVASALAATQDASTIIQTVLEEYLQALNLKQGSVVIFDFEAKTGVVKVSIENDELINGRSRPEHHRITEGHQIDLRNNPIYQRLMSSHQPVVIEDTQADWLTPSATLKSGRSGRIGGGWGNANALSMLVIPIQMRGEITGAIVVEALQKNHVFDRWALSLGQAMADQLGIGLQNVQLYELEYQRRQQAETLREVSFIVGSSLNLHDVLERILDQLGRVVKYDSAAIHLIEGSHRRIIAERGSPHPEKVIGLIFPVKLDRNEPGSVAIHTHQPLVIGDVSQLYESFRHEPHNHIKSWMGIPLIAREKVIGLISIDRMEPNVYTEGDVNLALAFANQVAITLENARLYEIEVRQLERELEIAQGIQETLLPQVVPQVPGLEICGRILPAQQIGGDFFHFFTLAQNQFGVAIGDVSGKGIPAALYMTAAMTAIDAQINDKLGPGALLNKLQRILYNRLQENKMNVGLQVATFTLPPASRTKSGPARQPKGRLMTLASAGMIAPIVATEQEYQLLPVSGLPIGSPLSDLVYNENEIPLEPATAIIFTSDGIVEARNEAGELFGFERLEATIKEIVGSQQAETIAEHIIETAQTFTGQAEQSDDMTVVVVIVKT